MKDFFIRLFTGFNAFIIRLTRGKIGSQLGTQSILILQTTGRKTGQPRQTPIAYFFREGQYLIVGSNWGRDHHADWYLNLQKQPQAEIQVNGQTVRVEAHSAEGEEYARLWEYVTKRHPPYLDYQKMTTRRIPIVVFQPISNSDSK